MSEENCTLTKIYSFSAAHRLHNDKFSNKKNKEIFGKCNNPKGHGHDYYLELTVKGDVAVDTGMIIDIEKLDDVAAVVIDELDYKRLDVEVDYSNDLLNGGFQIKNAIDWKRFLEGSI